jgi:TFIIF-interacting CTD phosphatase-like protein
VKDLTILLNGRRIQDIVIVDNKIESYASNLENGIPITDFIGQDDDSMLEHLERYLIKSFSECEDVREVIKRDFSVRTEKLDELRQIN